MKLNKTIYKIINITIIVIMILNIISQYVYAISLPTNLDSIYNSKDPTIGKMGGQIIWIVQIIFYAAAVIIVMFAGVKYMISAPEAKAEFKKKLAYMVTGAIILFAAGSLVGLIGGMAMNNISGGTPSHGAGGKPIKNPSSLY